jgi:hypothetical protein
MAINERLVHTASAVDSGAAEAEQGLVLHLDANDVDSYDGDGSVWYDISEHDVTIPLSDNANDLKLHINPSDPNSYSGTGNTITDLTGNYTVTKDSAISFDIDNGGYFDKAKTDDITTNYSPDNLTEFTAEAWINPDSGSQNVSTLLIVADSSNSNVLFTMYLRANQRQIQFATYYGGSSFVRWNPTGDTSVQYDKWQHIVMTCKNNGKMVIYLDGEVKQTLDFPYTMNTSVANLEIGHRLSASDQGFNGQMGAVRFYSKQLSVSEVGQNYRHGRDYIYTDLVDDTDLELHLDPASYSGTGTTWTADAGNNGTLVGDTSYDQELGDFFDLDGSGDYISLNSGGYLTGDFTVEMWWNFDTLSGFKMLWGGSGYSNGTGLGHYIDGNRLHTYISVSGSAVSPTGQSGAVLTVGKWHHIVLTRSGGTYTQYVDGINVGSGTGSTTSLESANTYIGAHYNNTAYNVDGRVGQVRVYNSALSEEAIRKNLNFTKNDYPNGNNATGNNMDSSDWNSGGYFDFDGSSEYFTTGDLGIRSSALTMSAWVNLDTYSTRAIIMLGSQAGNAGKAILFRTQDSGKLAFYDGSAVYTTSNVVLTLNTWHHVALAVNGTSYEFFVDGNSEGSATALEYSGDDTLDIGYYGLGNSQHWDGFIGSIKIYNKTLTSGEILADYNATESTY